MAPRSVALALILAPGARALLAGVQRKDPVAQACPEGYAAIPGDVGGWDQFGREQANVKATMQACAEDCEGRKECLSFEWGPTTKICSLNHDYLPNMGPLEDYTFCQKALVRPYRRPTQAPVAKPLVPFASSKSANLLESTKGSLDTSKQLIESPQAKVKRAVSEAVHAAVADNQSPAVAKLGAEAAAKAVAAGKTLEEAKAAAEGLWKKAAPAGAAAGNTTVNAKNATAERAAAEAKRAPAREESAEVKLRREAYKTKERYGYAPGAYSVKFERVPVTRRQARDSQIVGWLQEGSHIEVSEVAKSLQGGRVRGKIEEPHGWISLAFPESKMYYVEKQ